MYGVVGGCVGAVLWEVINKDKNGRLVVGIRVNGNAMIDCWAEGGVETG